MQQQPLYPTTQDESGSQSFKTKLQHHQSTTLALLDALDTHRFMGGAIESVSILLDLLYTVISEYQESYLQTQQLSHELHLKSKSDNDHLQQQLSTLQRSSRKREAALERSVSELEATVQKLSKENSDLTSMLTNAQIETSIHAKKTKEKLALLMEHKHICFEDRSDRFMGCIGRS